MRRGIEKLGLVALRRIDPELAHGLALKALHSPLVALPGPVKSARLTTRIAGMTLANPVGLAAGFDKNATAIRPLIRAGFGFIEVGAATPLPQSGNTKPRLFRLTEDAAAINRFGFNNDGADAIVARLARAHRTIPVGLNLGANKDSANRAEDFARVLQAARDHIDFATVNVSSPNTEKLRDLQGPMALAALLDGVMQVRGSVPVFLKIAPDLTDQDLADIAKVAEDARVAAIIATNTTLDRIGLRSIHAGEAGGLSGAPLFEKSTRTLAKLHSLTDIPLIGVGGIGSARDAYSKIRAGASAVQLYTGLVYGGLSLAARIAQGLDVLLQQDGFGSVADAVGTNTKDWL
ncbi:MULTISPECIES: quinone-dependent dihydroorotate dehydrogenase [Roseobacteraceae]|uniref:Dihydroorotate dehydrogenase (quinone) n=1 Tax=Pseudosulfitobacter pseudonitzschiae TaxID=1402135 RepID=A0A221K2D1_9RHOB|nr:MULTISPECIES: quinone-dependent dihydroorotate dehydrogenase [Roseobacteraceae]ASM73129.1 dihydroorotate dehydrogenase (quinone) [Pseudosulfitobacter pseudonitzschiae]